MINRWCVCFSTLDERIIHGVVRDRWVEDSHDTTGKGKGNRSGTDVAKKARAAADKAAQIQTHVHRYTVRADKDDRVRDKNRS